VREDDVVQVRAAGEFFEYKVVHRELWEGTSGGSQGRINHLSWRREDLGWISKGSSLLWEWWGAGTAAQRGCVPGGVQGQVGWGPGQPGLVLKVEIGGPAYSRGVGASWSLRSFPTQAILRFYDASWDHALCHSLTGKTKPAVEDQLY